MVSEEDFRYDLTGLSIQSAISLAEQVRSRVRSIEGSEQAGKVGEGRIRALDELNAALTEHVYQCVLRQDNSGRP